MCTKSDLCCTSKCRSTILIKKNCELRNCSQRIHKFSVAVSYTHLDVYKRQLLNPRTTWVSKDAYDMTAQKLVEMFQENFKQYTNFPEMIINAGPGGKINNTF